MIKGLKIFPNPFTHDLFISCECNELIGVEIINVLGQSVWKQQVSIQRHGTRLPLATLPVGVYWVKIQLDNGWEYEIRQVQRVE